MTTKLKLNQVYPIPASASNTEEDVEVCKK